MKAQLFAMLFAFSLAGCVVSVGHGEGVQKISEASQDSLQKQFQVGVATRNDVAMQLGAPTEKSDAGDFEIWNYRYTKRAAVGIVFVGVPVGSTKAASFYFDKNSGILKKIEFESHQG
jgi:outer membrane protein assembly factor BamE (lipoprotein component of BamABCDE complex)